MFNFKKNMRVPRKKKKQIPEGMYCYTATSEFKNLGDGQWGYTIKPCPFYEYKGKGIHYSDVTKLK